MVSFFKVLSVTLVMAVPAIVRADADGPDYFRVVGVAEDDVLNIRAEASAGSTKTGAIPPDGNGIRNLGCQGGLSFAQWEKASQAQRDAAARKRWCQIEYKGTSGWVAGRFLGEGAATQQVTEQATGPSFACSAATGQVETEICSDPHLASMDRELARLYGLAVEGSHMNDDRLSALKAFQRGWIKGRDECWKADEGVTTCVAASYAMRIDEIRTGYADARSQDVQGISLGPFAYVCDGLDAVLSVVVVNADPSMLSIRWRDSWITPTQQRSGSGANYGVETADGTFGFWMKGRTATFTQPGQSDLACHQDDIG